MTNRTRKRLQPGHRLLGPLAMVGLLISSVDAGPRTGVGSRPKVQKNVPQLSADSHSKNFIATRIADDTQAVEGEAVAPEAFKNYADNLAEVLATFTPAQQRKIIYGE